MNLKNIIIILFAVLLTSCSSKVLQVDNAEEILKIDAYDSNIKVEETDQPPPPKEKPVVKALVDDTEKKEEAPKKTKKQPEKKATEKAKPKPEKKAAVKKRQPSFEDSEGFDGRRPIADPFRPGEKVTLKLSYFNVVAGELDIMVMPFKEVNNRKSYHFKVAVKSNKFFSRIYAVDDSAETFVDYETLLPYNMALDVKESKQLKTVRSYFDWDKKRAFYWEKKIKKDNDNKVEEKKYDWEIKDYAQNIFSAVFYLRTFTLTPGKVISFRVADNKKNMMVKGHILRRETIKTEVGEFKTVVVKPEVQISGVLRPMGDVHFWLTDDDRKMIVKLESAIKIGTIVGSLTKIVP